MINIYPSPTEIKKGLTVDKLYGNYITYLEDYRTIILGNTAIYQGFRHGFDCFIGHNTVIREHVSIGDGVKIGSLCSIEQNVSIGDRTNIQAGVYIGAVSYTHLTLPTILLV